METRGSGSRQDGSVLLGYGEWMQRHRGIAASTLRDFGRSLTRVFRVLGHNPALWTASALQEFVVTRAGRCSRGQISNEVTAIRSFLRFTGAEGLSPVGLDAAVPTIRRWRLSELPRYLPPGDVERIVRACDARTAVGTRDRAIVLLLARLGLRAAEVVGLCFDDIDWEGATIRIVGKGRREGRLPLPQEVGNALLSYLRRGRPRIPSPFVFLTAISRSGRSWPLKPCGPSNVVRAAMSRAGVVSPHRGAHVLRHSLATAMLRSGSSLQAIAAVLRHHSLESTAIYAKVDVALLNLVAQPWPQVASW